MQNESDRDRVIRNGRAALKRLQNDRNWTDWLAVGEAILIGREECKEACGLKDTNLPPGHWGSAYSRMFGEWLEKEKLDFDKGDRSRLLDVMDRLPAIESWRNTLTRTERMRLNHPSTVWRKWKAATAERETLPQAAPSGWGGAIETLIAAKREGAFLKMTDVDPVLSAAPYRRRDLTDLATVLSNLATYWKRNKKKIRAEG